MFVEKSKRDKIPIYKLMNVVLVNVKKWIDMGRVAIDAEAHHELMTDLRIATTDEEMSLQKTEYSMDLLDSLGLAFEYIVY